MTIGGWFIFAILTIFIVGCGIILGVSIADNEVIGGFTGGVISVLLSIILLIGMFAYYRNTESGKRAIKTQQSNFGGGISRTVKVYDINGNLIQEYEGKFDVDYDAERIIFDDENGKRHIIYYTTGTIIIDET